MVNRSALDVRQRHHSAKIAGTVSALWRSIDLEHSITSWTVHISCVRRPGTSTFVRLPHFKKQILALIVNKQPLITAGRGSSVIWNVDWLVGLKRSIIILYRIGWITGC